VRIRDARYNELVCLQQIERAAGRAFREIGMPQVADDEPLSVAELARYHRAGMAWVSVDAFDRPVAYLIAEPLDGSLHVEQVSVHPDHARRGRGRELLDHAAKVAADAGIPAITLTTFREVPWNAPYYRRCGFRDLSADEITPGLDELRRQEARHGLDRWPRISMRRDLDPAS